MFHKATKARARARIALIGPAGSGKTYSALQLAKSLGGKVAVIDTERGSASKYADLFSFDVCELDSFEPLRYVKTLKAAEEAGYEVIVVDSLSHAWSGKGGALEQVDMAAKRDPRGNSYAAWRNVTPMQTALVDAMLGCKAHVIVTMRTKTEYVVEKDDRGKSSPRKIGLAPVQRDGLEYEFDVVADMDADNNFIVSKTRCPELSGKIFNKPGDDVGAIVRAWLSDGAEPAEPTETPRFVAPVEETTGIVTIERPADPLDEEVARAEAQSKGMRLVVNDGTERRLVMSNALLKTQTAEELLSWCHDYGPAARGESPSERKALVGLLKKQAKKCGVEYEDAIAAVKGEAVTA